jgi:hypothetical protein
MSSGRELSHCACTGAGVEYERLALVSGEAVLEAPPNHGGLVDPDCRIQKRPSPDQSVPVLKVRHPQGVEATQFSHDDRGVPPCVDVVPLPVLAVVGLG